MAAGSSTEYAETKHGATSSRKKATSGERDRVIGDFKLRVVARGLTSGEDPRFLFHLHTFPLFLNQRLTVSLSISYMSAITEDTQAPRVSLSYPRPCAVDI